MTNLYLLLQYGSNLSLVRLVCAAHWANVTFHDLLSYDTSVCQLILGVKYTTKVIQIDNILNQITYIGIYGK